jgi:2,4-dienoyl-CoA reductase-like NADH-dependent reductase (Old Yellow Enzyme family)
MNAITSDTTTEVLASPFTINKLLIKNRIVLGPMAVLRPTENGRPSGQTTAFLARRAKGGVGLVIVGGSVASERAWNESPFFPNLRFDKDEFVPGLARLVDAVHGAGSPLFAQLFPSFGRMAWLPQLRIGLDTEDRCTARPGRLSLVRTAARLDTRTAPGRGCAPCRA